MAEVATIRAIDVMKADAQWERAGTGLRIIVMSQSDSFYVPTLTEGIMHLLSGRGRELVLDERLALAARDDGVLRTTLGISRRPTGFDLDLSAPGIQYSDRVGGLRGGPGEWSRVAPGRLLAQTAAIPVEAGLSPEALEVEQLDAL